MEPVTYVKGHGTENDFVVLPDPDGRLTLTPTLVRALCDRRGGIGADGVLRVVRTAAAPAGAPPGAEWFMDHHNADGSTAQMCGNGIRLYARYLLDAGLAAPGMLRIGTRSGVREVTAGAVGDVSVDMGRAAVLGPGWAVVGGRRLSGVQVDVGNPHLVCEVTDLDGWDLDRPPAVDRAVFPDGVNVELVATVAAGHLAMRVGERGVGETRSCGTGAVAVAAAAAGGSGASSRWTIDVPGGRLGVTLDSGTARLTGPAVVVGAGVLDRRWLALAGE